jgi:stage II sporulation protein D
MIDSESANAEAHTGRTPAVTRLRFAFCFLPLALLLACRSERTIAPDVALQRASERALGEREGAILVIDAQTGRLRAAVNPRLAFEQSFPPGSAIKPFTALVALRSGVVPAETRRRCAGRFARGDFEIVCSHPQTSAPFDLPQALAYSCNDYFAHLGERISESAFTSTLASFGFGARAGVNAVEAEGRLPRGAWGPRLPLGEDDDLLVTPVQLLAAYTALVNGGRLFAPRLEKMAESQASVRARLAIDAEQRAALIAGMRGAVRFGTASAAHLERVRGYVFGKTGTSTSSNGFRTQGWFVGFHAAGNGDRIKRAPAPEEVRLGVIVFLKRAHGSEGAEVARAILEAAGELEEEPEAIEPELMGGPHVKVRLISEGETRELPLEEYLIGVVSAEAGVIEEPAALEAQAVASRTFAMKNRGRHAAEGYDLCSTTHCQRYAAESRGEPGSAERARRAVRATRGETLRERGGGLADAYFHAACGGATADLKTLWGVDAPPYLRGARDDYCADSAHRSWLERVAAPDLARALRSDPRSDPGGKFEHLIVIKRDASGRVETLAIEGAQRRLLNGWEFKLIVGRALGWDVLKSSRFEVSRAGGDFVFRGSGFGHGLGLCQAGARVMARRGIDHRRILAHYYPGTDATTEVPTHSSAPINQGARRAILSSEHFRASFTSSTEQREVESALEILEAAWSDLRRRLDAAGLRFDGGPIELIAHGTTADFIAATGWPGWVAAATRGRRIETQPLGLLTRRGLLVPTLRHELAHTAIETLGRGRAPRWLAEGLASHFAGEGSRLDRARAGRDLSRDEIERRLAGRMGRDETRIVYAAAWREVQALIRAEGESAAWQRVAALL